MKKVILACDLDNTLIHSYKHKKDDDICIEFIKEKEQGYMPVDDYRELHNLDNEIMIVPVTTRSIEQYQRIQWPKPWEPQFAVTTNGAILLDNNEVDQDWTSKSRSEADQYMEEMQALLMQLEAEGDYIRCRMVDEMYIFSYCKEGVNVSEKVRKYAKTNRLSVIASGKKIYFFPPYMNKGEAVKNLRKKFIPDFVIAAGDSSIDIPMLNEADLAVCKKDVFDMVSNNNKKMFNEKMSFCENIMQVLKGLEKTV